jgi:hypothetical protein
MRSAYLDGFHRPFFADLYISPKVDLKPGAGAYVFANANSSNPHPSNAEPGDFPVKNRDIPVSAISQAHIF